MEEVTPHTGVGTEPLTGAHTHPTVQCMTCGEGREDAATTAPNAHGHGKESRKGDEPLHIPPKERGQWGEGVTHAITRAKGVESATAKGVERQVAPRHHEREERAGDEHAWPSH